MTVNERLPEISLSQRFTSTPEQIRGVIDMAIEEGEHLIRVSRIENSTKRITVTGIGHATIFDVPADFKVLP
jgi:hypothetical protein